jgi:type II secretory ATPase GspE/PulE/Tfp pilus assembly ATPase PilB-like protein
VTRGAGGQIKTAAIAAGMRTLRDDAVGMVLNGVTTIDELLRATHADV